MPFRAYLLSLTVSPMALLFIDRPWGSNFLLTAASALFVVLLVIDLVGRFG